MTREEAIEKLNEAIKFAYSEADAEVCRMAIAALREQEERTCETCYGNDMALDKVDNPCWNCKAGHSEWAPREQEEQKITLIQQYIKVPEKPQWINVEDALPVINDNEPLGEFVTDRGYKFIVSDGEYVWTELFWLKAKKFDDESVTHWRPLPTVPPKED